jgi:hypothetical protein
MCNAVCHAHAGAYSSLSRAGGGSQGELQGQAAGSRFAAGPGSMTAASSSSSLATRSINPHIPPVAPVTSSLYKVSTGLGGYKPGVSAAVATAAAVAVIPTGDSAGVNSSSSRRQQQGVSRSLACSSMPVQQGVGGSAARGRLLPSAADFATAGSRRDDGINNVSNNVTEDAAPGSMLDVISKAMGRISRMSAALGPGGAAAAVAASARGGSSRAGGPDVESSDWDDASSMYKGSHGLGKNSSYGTGSVQMGGVSAEELADARSWLLSGALVGQVQCCVWTLWVLVDASNAWAVCRWVGSALRSWPALAAGCCQVGGAMCWCVGWPPITCMATAWKKWSHLAFLRLVFVFLLAPGCTLGTLCSVHARPTRSTSGI